MALPLSKKAMQSFLGKMNWIGKFIKDKQNLLAPLQDMIHGDKLPPHTDETMAIFEKCKTVLTDLVLWIPDLNKESLLQMDASFIGLDAVLFQYIELTDSELKVLEQDKDKWKMEDVITLENGKL